MIITLIIFLPLINICILGFFGNFFGLHSIKVLTLLNIGLALILTITLFCLNIKGYFFYCTLGVWLSLDFLSISWGFIFDAISTSMLSIVFIVSFLVHAYSFEYMYNDPYEIRFYSLLSLFTFFMAFLLCADNFILLFLGWEGVGLCSYLLINFWFTRISANKSAMKAIFINKFGDFSLLFAIFLIFYTFKTLDFLTLMNLVPFFYNKFFIFNNLRYSVINLICFFLVIGSISKSAQILLHVWLPDAMEGPTPVSALIHAATMVTVGIFLILRTSFFFEYAPEILNILISLGAVTAFLSAFIGCFQLDIKKIIAYSTCSQLGYMFAVCGLSGYNYSLYHLINHAFFKALLFLSAGMLIHSLLNEQDIRRMGSLLKVLPLTFCFFFLGTIALTGLPFFSGFYSKDLILELFFIQINFNAGFAFWLLIISALLTTIYSLRLIYFVFLEKIVYDLEYDNTFYKIIYYKIKEANIFLIIPLCVLALGSIMSGYFLQDLFVGQGSEFFRYSLYILPKNELQTQIEHTPVTFKTLPFFLSFFGLFLIFNVFVFFNKKHQNFYIFKNFYRVFISKLYFDEIYNTISIIYFFPIGLFILQCCDNGILEVLGPRGFFLTFFKIVMAFNLFLDKFLYNYFQIYFFFLWILLLFIEYYF